MIQKVQSGEASVIGDFNHFNIPKVLEQFAPVCHAPCVSLGGTLGVCDGSVKETKVSRIPVGLLDHKTVHLLCSYRTVFKS